MRKQIWIPLIVVLAVCLLLLVKTKQHHQTALPEQSEVPTNQPSRSEPPKVVVNRQVLNTSQPPPLPPSAPSIVQILASTNSLAAKRLALWQAPINFYGKVIDENSNLVAAAQVAFHWVEIPSEEGNRTANKESDTEGLFSLLDATGLNLSVSVSKEGYYTSRKDNDSFTYGSLGGAKFSPDPLNPVIFHLRKKGQGVELITSDNGMRRSVSVRIPKDNTPVRVDFFQKQASATGQLEISQNKPPWQGATNWSFSLSIQDGGLIENQDEFQFAALETGYQPTVGYDFTKGETNWTTHAIKQFYIAFGQPRKYGWLRIESDIAQETIYLTYAINPTGSRNLEPAN
jgi:hypothetical protein